MIKPMQQSTLEGIQRARTDIHGQATRIARIPAGGTQRDLARSLVEMHRSEQSMRANAKTLKTAHETLGTLLDELA